MDRPFVHLKFRPQFINALLECDSGKAAQQELGIVYYPQRPYLLGISVRGADSSVLPGILSDISRVIYAEVDRQNEPFFARDSVPAMP